MHSVARAATAIFIAFALTPASAQGELNVVCSVQQSWCEAVAEAFLKETGIRAAMTHKSAGEATAQIAAEKTGPRFDLWYAGSADSHLQAAELGLTEEYASPLLPQLHDWAVRLAEQAKFRAVGIHAAVLGIGYNPDVLARKKLPTPKCWADLANPVYAGEIQMANPLASDAAYATLATFLQIFGEDRGFALLKAVHRNTGSYPRSSTGAIRAVARGETGIGVTFLHDGIAEIVGGFRVGIVAPCEGTGYDVGSMSIVRGARNLEHAKKFYDWALTPQAQRIAGDLRHFQIPSNRAVPRQSGAPEVEEIRLIAYDFAKYAGASERKRMLEKWEREVFAISR
jgi:iron(III) transport system substrate-binding protein